MFGWNHCGEGFSGIDKYKHILINVSSSSQSEREREVAWLVNTDKTPEGKRQRQNMKVTTHRPIDINAKHKADSILTARTTAWNKSNFLMEFDPDSSSKKSEEIHWNSSSDESGGDKSPEQNRKRKLPVSEKGSFAPRGSSSVSSNVAGCRFQTSMSRQEKSDASSILCQQLQEPLLSQSSIDEPTKLLVSHVKTDDPDILSYSQDHGRKNIVENYWATFSFDELKCSYFPGIRKKRKSPLKESFQEAKDLRTRAVCKLDNGRIQESCDQIVQVESDMEENIMRSDDEDDKLSASVVPPQYYQNASFTSQGTSEVIDVSSSGDTAHQTLNSQSEIQESQVIIDSSTSSEHYKSPQGETIKASDWITVLQKQKTPVKGEQERNSHCEDSAKKKRKFARGSLAEQLNRFLAREKASIRFWYHSVKAGTIDDSRSKSMVLELLSLERQFSGYASLCRCLDGPNQGGKCKAVFMRDTVETLSLKPGMTVKLFPPWQQLEESNHEFTLLCTHFMRVMTTDNPNVSTSKEQDLANNQVTVSAAWKCPCSQDPCLSAGNCPAYVSPVNPNLSAQGLNLCTPHSPPTALLHSIPVTPCHLTSNTSTRRTLHESIEGRKDPSFYMPPFSAFIIRVFRHSVKGTGKIRHQLLVEDFAGALGVVTLSEDFDACSTIYHLQGRMITCSGLCVITRTNRDKGPALFSVVDQAWRGELAGQPGKESQKSATSQTLQVPDFAYLLQFMSGVNLEVDENEDEDGRETQALELLTVEQAVKDHCSCRVSFLAKPVLPSGWKYIGRSRIVKSECQEGDDSVTVFVYDDSTGGTEEYTLMQRLEIGNECVVDDLSSQQLCLFTDVISEKGLLRCDRFSLVISCTSLNLWGSYSRIDPHFVRNLVSCQLKLPPVCPTSEPESFVAVEGQISSIDEHSSYSWEECGLCGSDNLAVSAESCQTFCIACNRKVDSPVMRMKMKAYIKCSEEFFVKLDLAQKTIESLLPSESDAEGYDVDVVIGQPIRCPACIVLPKTIEMDGESSTPGKAVLMLKELVCP